MINRLKNSAGNVCRGLVVLLAFVLVSGCATLTPSYETPEVQLTKIELLPSRGFEQRFLIGLRLVNPNRFELKLNGLSYSLTLQGHKIVSGVSSDMSPVAAYGEADISVEAGISLISGLRFFNELISNPSQTFNYELDTKLDSGWWLTPIHITESGSISLDQL